ncbi:hypothetical protein E0I00_26760, partial [Pseudomonas syringae pv. actinidiae]|nr:hypothetical protein [Pseudomonas syringae pv. actinidiae]
MRQISDYPQIQASAGGRRSELVRDLPGTGSKTGASGTSGTTKVTHFGPLRNRRNLLKYPRPS